MPDRSKGPLAIEVTVTSLTPPTVQYEQAGLTWYNNGKPGFKFVKERVDGKLLIIPGRVPMDSKTVELRLVVDGNRLTAQFRPDAKGEFKTAAEAKLPEGGKDQISIQCYHGPTDDGTLDPLRQLPDRAVGQVIRDGRSASVLAVDRHGDDVRDRVGLQDAKANPLGGNGRLEPLDAFPTDRLPLGHGLPRSGGEHVHPILENVLALGNLLFENDVGDLVRAAEIEFAELPVRANPGCCRSWPADSRSDGEPRRRTRPRPSPGRRRSGRVCRAPALVGNWLRVRPTHSIAPSVAAAVLGTQANVP